MDKRSNRLNKYPLFLSEIEEELKARRPDLSLEDFLDYNFDTDFRLLMTVAETVDELMILHSQRNK